MVTPDPHQSLSSGAEPGRDFLIRSEELLSVRTERVPSGWARLEKYLVTETRTVTVELTHEEVRLVRGPVDPGGPATRPATTGMNTARWMYLNREELVITKQVVPAERVRLEVYTVTEQQQITETVRKEQFADEPTITGQNEIS